MISVLILLSGIMALIVSVPISLFGSLVLKIHGADAIVHRMGDRAEATLARYFPPGNGYYRRILFARLMRFTTFPALYGCYISAMFFEITFPTVICFVFMLSAELFLHAFQLYLPIIQATSVATVHSFCLDKFFVLLAVFAGVLLSVANVNTMPCFLIICVLIPGGCIVETALDLKTPMNLAATFFSLSFIPLVNMAMENPSYWAHTTIPLFLYLFFSYLAFRFGDLIFLRG